MGQVTLIGGKKGGTGKSFCTNSLIYTYDFYKVKYTLIDADINNPDVAELNSKGFKKIGFSVENDETALMSKEIQNTDRIYELACENDVIVNLPADVENKLSYWLTRNDLLSGEVNEG
nr:hypothetical protein [Prochloraceae cyanobacterium]